MSLLYPQRISSIAHSPPSPGPGEYELDFETAALIAKLALEDIEDALNSRKGKSRSDAPLSDEEYAYRLQYESFQQVLAVSEDAKVANSINDAVRTDAALLEAFIVAEEAAVADRRAARMVHRGESLPAPNAAQTRLESRNFAMHPEPPIIQKPDPRPEPDDSDISDTESFVGAFDMQELLKTNPKTIPSPKRTRVVRRTINAPAGPSVNRNRSVNCTICTDAVRYINALHTPCDHDYCATCTVSLVEHATRDESLFPVKCCQLPIPISEVAPMIPTSLFETYQEKQAEFDIPSQDRIYCVNSICSTFLGSSANNTDGDIVCHKCGMSTCPRCKRKAHQEADCAVNAAGIQLRALAVKSGWQTCPGCNALVEKNQGCNHITCRCTAQFCYICSLKWKTCRCPQ